MSQVSITYPDQNHVEVKVNDQSLNGQTIKILIKAKTESEKINADQDKPKNAHDNTKFWIEYLNEGSGARP